MKLANLLSNEPNIEHRFGLSLEDFFDETIRCQKGYIFDGERDIGLQKLFSRKSGPIFCIVEIAIENFDE